MVSQIPPGPGKPRAAIAKYDDAVATFRAAWKEEIEPDTATHSPKASAHRSSVLDGKLRARLMVCREARKQAAGAPAATKVEEFGLFATLSALDREGTCWELIATDPTADVHAYFDAKTGALVCAFLQPAF
jgi:hypothetical protein